MRNAFEDENVPAGTRRDTELTLGAGAVFGLALGVLLLCGLCFGAGFAVGYRGSARPGAAHAPTAAPDQEPLQGSAAIPKPSAAETVPAPPLLPVDAGAAPAVGAPPGETVAVNPNGAQPGAAPNGTAPGAAGNDSAQVRPALPGGSNATYAAQGAPASGAHTALPAQTQWMVQVAEVANATDAQALTLALRQRGYAVTPQRDPADGLVHVRIGPFSSRDLANRWRDRLLGDGYNAVVQP